ncbi:MAG: hypothetical protein QF704_13540, partial [Anaerolineales bacterium]|nr:hypothetical protein [Anaerolineales bacterium]
NDSTESGGGIRIWEGSTVSIQQSAFVENYSNLGGGVRVMNNQGQTNIENCLFLANEASNTAGVMFSNSNATVTGCAFKKNVGGGLRCTGGSSNINVFDSLFCGNTPANTSGNCGYYEGNLFYEECCDADLTDDQLVNVDDLLIVVSDLNCEQSGNCDNYGSDINGDGAVNVIDLLIIIDSWGYCVFE